MIRIDVDLDGLHIVTRRHSVLWSLYWPEWITRRLYAMKTDPRFHGMLHVTDENPDCGWCVQLYLHARWYETYNHPTLFARDEDDAMRIMKRVLPKLRPGETCCVLTDDGDWCMREVAHGEGDHWLDALHEAACEGRLDDVYFIGDCETMVTAYARFGYYAREMWWELCREIGIVALARWLGIEVRPEVE